MVNPKNIKSEEEGTTRQKIRGNKQMPLLAQNGLEMHTTTILEAIKETKMALGQRIYSTSWEVSLPKTDHKKLADRASATERTVAYVHPRVMEKTASFRVMDKEVAALVDKLHEPEHRSLCNKIPLVGFPERLQGLSTKIYLEEWLSSMVLKGKTAKWFTVESAHKVPGRPPELHRGPW
ncbi:hypothetical protein NDU88_005002 [Pleurodeles waltl]|uniref:Uncharacterized protein n=1 Tax=Pleurodeles waltl TaxID=8319 RepID=A0AAV7W6L8_PLEWA|nr:hypothetical protein NDU88_005002 [Pleurodeles waltl]